ncbi:MAG: hypothetical protein COA60_001175 [Robiginitomaculum sp.]|nr:hypothetical protein [Robiginitomaculum sp.]
MPQQKKTWNEKLAACKQWQVKPAPMSIAGMKAGQVMLVPDGELLSAAIRKIPKGNTPTIKQFRLDLAKSKNAEVCCPITTGILLRTIAEAAFESYEAGSKISEMTPIWRLLDESAPTWKKLSFDTDFLVNLREQETQ